LRHDNVFMISCFFCCKEVVLYACTFNNARNGRGIDRQNKA
jgi:hypothetical protein